MIFIKILEKTKRTLYIALKICKIYAILKRNFQIGAQNRGDNFTTEVLGNFCKALNFNVDNINMQFIGK